MATQDTPPLTDEALAEMLRYYHLDSLEFRAASELRRLRAAASVLLAQCKDGYDFCKNVDPTFTQGEEMTAEKFTAAYERVAKALGA